MKTKTVIAFIAIILIVIFSIQNSEVTEVKLLFLKLSMSRVLIILGSFSIGVVVGVLLVMKKRIFPPKITSEKN